MVGWLWGNLERGVVESEGGWREGDGRRGRVGWKWGGGGGGRVGEGMGRSGWGGVYIDLRIVISIIYYPIVLFPYTRFSMCFALL